MNKKISLLSLLGALLSLPLVVLAGPFDPSAVPQPTAGWSGSLSALLMGLLTMFWWVVVAIVVVLFVIAGIKFLTAQGNPGKIEEARNAAIWGVVGVVVILLAYSIITALRGPLGA